MKIRGARFVELPAISRQVERAVAEDYGFYPPGVRRTIAARNGWRPLFATWRHPNRRILVAVDKFDVIQGQLIGTYNADDVAIVHWLYVAPEGRKGGMARKLLGQFESEVRLWGVEKVMLWTEIAPGYYEKIGWVQEAKLPNHWWGQDFYVFSKYLK
jgi:GNAT superfamily N-acetyltransferase